MRQYVRGKTATSSLITQLVNDYSVKLVVLTSKGPKQVTAFRKDIKKFEIQGNEMKDKLKNLMKKKVKIIVRTATDPSKPLVLNTIEIVS